jgi:RimJ/RimL family protein N-acetyltransferase
MEIVMHNVYLSPLQMSDAVAINGYMQDGEIAANTLRIPFPYKLEDAEMWLEDNLIFEEESGKRQNYAIRNQQGNILGCIGIHFNYGTHSDKSEFGYWLGKEHWNKGIMTEAIKQFCLLLSGLYNIKTLEANVFAYNVASQKVLVKCGFTQKVYVPRMYNKNGKRIDGIKFIKEL